MNFKPPLCFAQLGIKDAKKWARTKKQKKQTILFFVTDYQTTVLHGISSCLKFTQRQKVFKNKGRKEHTPLITNRLFQVKQPTHFF